MNMLAGVDWMSTVKPDDDDYVAAHIAWLQTASPEDWHRVALDFNWTNRLEPLLWIVMQDECELATALEVFWRCEPGWDLMLMAMGETVDARDEADIIACIAQRLHAGSYTSRTIAFDPEAGVADDYAEMESHCAQIAAPPFRPHPDMVASITGREVTNDRAFYARYPEVFHGSVFVELPEPASPLPAAAPQPESAYAPAVRPRPRPQADLDGGATLAADLVPAARHVRVIIFNIGLFGVALHIGRLVDLRVMTNLVALGVLAVGMIMQMRDANAAAGGLRSLIETHGGNPSKVGNTVLGGLGFAAGFALAAFGFEAYFALESGGAIRDPSGYTKMGVPLLAAGLLWAGARLASPAIARRLLRA